MCEEAQTPSASYRDQGNAEYAKKNYLKAAALYTQGLKEQPKDATLMSNRSAALLKLNKVGKALADAEACVTLKPDWHKAYYRRALALETAGRLEEAIADFQTVLDMAPGENKDIAAKIKALSKQVQKRG